MIKIIINDKNKVENINKTRIMYKRFLIVWRIKGKETSEPKNSKSSHKSLKHALTML